jgi:hypothetical protein|tara:strand:- start:8112 stop:9155 length:1044 start_codon:yes stop_codon:yes gene_type:complete
MIHHFILKLLRSLNKQKINYAILRNYESIPNKPKDVDYFDIDMIVSSKDIKKFNKILNQTIIATKTNLIKIFKRSYCHHYRIVKYHNKKFTSVQIDVHTKGQGFWGFYYLLEDEILNYKKKYKEFFVVSDFHQHLFNWLDKLLWGELKLKYSKPIKRTMKKEMIKLLKFLKKINLNEKKITDIKNIFLSKNNSTEDTKKYKRSILSSVIFWSIFKHPIKTINWTIEFFLKELKLRIFPPGLFVVVKKQNKQAKNIYSILCTTAIMGQKSLFVNFNQLSRYKYFYHYITTVWPIVRKHGLVVCVYDKINFGNNLEYKKNDMSSKLIKDILSQYKIKNIIFSPNIFIKN